MSTNNPLLSTGIAPGVQGEFGGAPVLAPSPTGLPDVETLAQLANALFSALPARPSVPGTAADLPSAPPASALPAAPSVLPGGEIASLPVASYVPPTSGFSPPSDAELRSAPASLAGVGGAPSPATAASPPGEPSYYFLAPDQAALPGTAVGLGPSSAARLESGALPTAPSPPAAFAQPAEPGIGSLAGVSGPVATGGLPVPLPFAFRPELVPDPGSVPLGGGATSPTPVPQAVLPQEVGSFPIAANAPPLAAAAPSVEAGPRGTLGGPGLQSSSGVSPAPSLYFLEEAGPYYGGGFSDLGRVPSSDTGPYGYPEGLALLEPVAYPLDSRLVSEGVPSQPTRLNEVPTGGAPSVVPGQQAAHQPLKNDPPPSPAIAGVGAG